MTVLLTSRKWRWRLGHLQLALWLAKQCNIRLRHLIQPVLGRCYCRLSVHGLEGEQADQRYR
jgi:hypothetical protein